MQQRIHELESRQSALAVDYVRLRVLQEENQSLRKVAGFLTESGYDHVGARVIARSTDTHTATILIDRGTVDGVENGMAVVAEDGVLVGKIVNITERSSEVMLISDERSNVAASRAGARTLLGLVEGEGRGIARLNLVPQEEALKPDEVVVTAGTEAKIPADLPLALVSDVQGVPTDPFKTATLEPLIDAGSLDLVVVLRPSALRPSPAALAAASPRSTASPSGTARYRPYRVPSKKARPSWLPSRRLRTTRWSGAWRCSTRSSPRPSR
jgi:rod shape-determining protein MreC